MQETSRINRIVWGISMICAPLLFGISTFLWRDGQYGAYGGTFVVMATVFWIAAFIGLFDLLKSKTPVYASLGLFIAIAGCISGANFGFAGAYNDIFSISHAHYLEQLAAFPAVAGILLFWSGPIFPLSLFVLGIVLVRTKSAPVWTGILISISGLAFPLSRIPRIEWIAHVCDALMFIPFCYLGFVYFLGTIPVGKLQKI
ncbi:hypothetical protein [Flavitalea sp.]|nr:hypothetical protein [Flavitalea sp.]